MASPGTCGGRRCFASPRQRRQYRNCRYLDKDGPTREAIDAMTAIIPIEQSKAGRRCQAGTRRRSPGQSRHPRHRGYARRARLPQGVPVRPPRDRGSGIAVEAGAERHHPAHPPGAQGARLPEDLEHREERISAQDHYARAIGQAGCGHLRPRPRHGRLGDALRQSVDRLADRRADGAGLRPLAGRAALSAIFGRDHRRPFATRCSACWAKCARNRRCG